MAEEETKNDAAEAGDDEAAAGGGKKKIILLVAIVVVIAIAGVAGFMLLGGDKEADEDPKPEQSKSEAPPAADGASKTDATSGSTTALIAYYALPDFLVNLNSPGRKSTFLKVSVTLELPDEEARAVIASYEPRIVDSFQTYLRELRPDDLKGSGGIFRLREELLLRVNKIVHPLKVNDILFKDMIVQ